MRDFSRREALAASLLGTISLSLPRLAVAGSYGTKKSKAEADGDVPYVPVDAPLDGRSATAGLTSRLALRGVTATDDDEWFGGTAQDVMIEVWVRNSTAQPLDLYGQDQRGVTATLVATHGGVPLGEAMHTSSMSRMMLRPNWVAMPANTETLVLVRRLTPPQGVKAADLSLAVALTLHLRDGRLETMTHGLRLANDLG